MLQRLARRSLLPSLAALLWSACGASSAEPAAPAAGAGPSASAAPVPGHVPPVPTGVRSRTLLTQPVEEDPPPPVPALAYGGTAPAEERVVGDHAVPEPRAVRGEGEGGRAGGLDRFKVRDVIHAAQGRISHCFDRLRQDNPRVTEARVSVRIEIAPEGSVDEVEVTGCAPEDTTFAGCIRTLVRSLDFPSASAPTVTTYPFVFSVATGEQ
ncbi:MAG: AgmX/PglI C-terminal domain-containing protein [Deltaproteobacteria bacterium]|nr:AgmX/PglI C-terminal domain-containing protein [Deltaproteobacteria bacterium]